MRTIPANVTSPEIRAELEALNTQIAEKMKQIEVLKNKMRSGKLSPQELGELKQISVSIDALDQRWKELAQS